MTAKRVFDVAILGGGPVGLVAALEASKHSSAILVMDRDPDIEIPPRLEAVPSAFINLLIGFGVHPGRIGVDRLHDARHLAWEEQAPCTMHGPSTAYLERPALERELFRLVARTNGLSVHMESARPSSDGKSWSGHSWCARSVIDATGRRALRARRRVHPPKPWIARTLWTSRPQASSDRILRIAALPFGYAYRLGSSRYDTLGLVGRGENLRGSPARLERAIKRAGGSWILEGLPSLVELSTGPAYPVSVQWSQTAAGIAIGDAALARDILSSQGLSTGVSEALYAAAIHTDEDVELFKTRQRDQRKTHLESLSELMAKCRFRDHGNWADYRAFVLTHRALVRSDKKVGLVAGQVVERYAGP